MADLFSIQAGLVLAVVVCGPVLLLTSRVARSRANDVLSWSINWYLLWRYPIRHIDGGRALPTYPYRFPNGQGDGQKFLDGTGNGEKWEQQSGSVYRIWSGTRGEVVLTRPEHIQAVFKDSDKHCKAVNINSGWLMSQLLGKCVGLTNKEEWKRIRSPIEQPFLRSVAVNYVPMIHKHVLKCFDDLHTESASFNGGQLDPIEDLKLLPFWIVCEVFYGPLNSRMINELKDLSHSREQLFGHIIRGGVSRFAVSKYLPTKANKDFGHFQSRWYKFNEMVYQNAKSSQSDAPIVHMYELVRNGTFTMEQLLQTLDESLYANVDVTSGAISWNIVFLAAYRRYQDAIREEAAAAPDREQYLRSSTTLLAACISESSRLRPLAAFSIPQSAPTTRVIDGYVIPAGTDFIVDSSALNIRNEFWGEDAAAYRPERFLEKGGAEVRYHVWRFGFGPRQCMGKYVADLMIRSLLVYLVENYDLSTVKGDACERNPESWINHPQVKLRCERRVRKS